MFILTTNEGYAYRDTSGLPVVCKSFDEARPWAEQGPYPLDDWYALELTKREADQIQAQAYMAMYGRRDGLDL